MIDCLGVGSMMEFEKLFGETVEVVTDELFMDKKCTKIHPDGLLSQQIFGPTIDYRCECGNLIGKYNKGKICPYCKVVCEHSDKRHTTFAHINLKLPVLNTLIRNRILMSIVVQEQYSKFIRYISLLINPTLSNLFFVEKSTGKIRTIEEFENVSIIHPELNEDVSQVYEQPRDYINKIMNKIGLDDTMIEYINRRYDLDNPIIGPFSFYLAFINNKALIERNLRKNDFYQVFKNLFFLKKLHVIPPGLRPIVQTDNKIIEHELTKILRRIIVLQKHKIFRVFDINILENRNNFTFAELYSYDILALRLQKLVDKYFQLIEKSFRGKKGFVRLYIHGKTIDFSARSVVIPSMTIKPYEIEISRYIAKEVLLPYFISFIIRNREEIENKYRNISELLIKLLAVINGFISQEKLSSVEKELFEKLFDEFIDYVNSGEIKIYAIMNRAPTLWIYNFLVFDVKIKKDRNDYTIGVHPLAVEQQNMDFDGDSIIGKIEIKINDKYHTLNIEDLENFEVEID